MDPPPGGAGAGRLGLNFSLDDWRPAPAAAPPGRLALEDPVTLVGTDANVGAWLIAGIAPAVNGLSLLPQSLPGKDAQPVRIGPYRGVRSRPVVVGGKRSTVYLVP